MKLFIIFIYLICYFTFGFITNAKVQKTMKEDPKEGYKLGNYYVRKGFLKILRFVGVQRIVIGAENLPDKTALFVSNHRSYFDILTTHVVLNRPVGYIAKSEMKNIPFLAQWMKNIGCLFLNRKNTKEALKTILDGVNLLKNNYVNLYIFPEGTRGHKDEVAPFKKGSFKMAEKANVPIVPIGIIGTDKLFENNGWFRKVRGGKVYIAIGEPIYYSQFEADGRKHIDEYVHDKVVKLIEDTKKKYDLD